MMYLEMSRDKRRDERLGSSTWGFKKCIWAPTVKRNGKRAGAYWEKVGNVHAGDIVLHLQGIPPNAQFVGYSTVAQDGEITDENPPDPGEWGYAKSFYRAALTNFEPFDEPVDLTNLFRVRQTQLESYFFANKDKGYGRLNLFYVKQAGRLQCQNGAYLSDVDADLLEALFDFRSLSNRASQSYVAVTSVRTGQKIAEMAVRIGQKGFADRTVDNYDTRCCFPGCNVRDRRFLVGSHIARWSDNENMRGELSNGLCLCVTHDKAFELGLFTLNKELAIHVSDERKVPDFLPDILKQRGVSIRLGRILPSIISLEQHWLRTRQAGVS